MLYEYNININNKYVKYLNNVLNKITFFSSINFVRYLTQFLYYEIFVNGISLEILDLISVTCFLLFETTNYSKMCLQSTLISR